MTSSSSGTETRASHAFFKRNTLIKYWGFGVLASLLVLAILTYILSPRVAADHLLKRWSLPKSGLTLAEQLVLQRSIHKIEMAHEPPAWEGPGQVFLQHIWPQLGKLDHPEQLILLQITSVLNNLPNYPTMRRQLTAGYRQFPNEFQVTLGPTDNPIELHLKRQHFAYWELSSLCSVKPQPVLTLNTCPSDNR